MQILAGILATALLAAPVKTGKLSVFGDLVFSYKDYIHRETGVMDADNFQFDEVGLAFNYDANDYVRAYSRLTTSGPSVNVSEAYVQLSGMKYNGALTIGKFYKPLGAPIPLASLSFPALAFHAYPDVGVKLNFCRRPFDVEVGVVNGNPLTPPPNQASYIGGTSIITNQNVSSIFNTDIDHRREFYGRVATSFGEDWGSLTLGLNGLVGRLSKTEIDSLNPIGNNPSQIGRFASQNRAQKRLRFSADLDYQTGPYRVFAEVVNAWDGRLHRSIASMAGSHTWYTKCGSVVGTIGYDQFRVNTTGAQYAYPETWNRRRYSGSLAWWPIEVLEFLVEYNYNMENVRKTPGQGKVGNDEFTLQSILYF